MVIHNLKFLVDVFGMKNSFKSAPLIHHNCPQNQIYYYKFSGTSTSQTIFCLPEHDRVHFQILFQSFHLSWVFPINVNLLLLFNIHDCLAFSGTSQVFFVYRITNILLTTVLYCYIIGAGEILSSSQQSVVWADVDDDWPYWNVLH